MTSKQTHPKNALTINRFINGHCRISICANGVYLDKSTINGIVGCPRTSEITLAKAFDILLKQRKTNKRCLDFPIWLHTKATSWVEITDESDIISVILSNDPL